MAKKKFVPNPAGNPSSLILGGVGKKKRVHLTAEQELFCIKRCLEMPTEAAVAEVGMSSAVGWAWNRDPRIKARIEEIRPQVREKLLNDEVRNYQLSLGHLDLETMRVASMQKQHKVRGFADKNTAIELAYRRLRAILPKTSVSATATAGAMATAQGSTVKEVYRSRWMIDNEEKIRLQLEAENALPAVNDSANPTS